MKEPISTLVELVVLVACVPSGHLSLLPYSLESPADWMVAWMEATCISELLNEATASYLETIRQASQMKTQSLCFEKI
jgi:hypothetical protein